MALQLTGLTMPRGIETAKLVRQDRSATFHAMTETRNQLAKARLVVLLAALQVTQVTVLIASVLVGLAGTSVPRVPFALFAFATFVLARRWVIADAAKAFSDAVRNGQVRLSGTPPRIISIAPSLSRRWLVLLYVQLHPALLNSESE